ncbi:hypothetical protein BS47DRAFT_1358946 [Hydnum rufescens UP504]|uniref:Uncharacterized protein n=1 Tax=Hydnum rufescens UP504 TaxID=1448309 RepID=A0A9P6DYG9_9AGAM|nr:hypothetical protein BS47DRAFT_1358946 [Hydnum rufescens UP504]
MKTQAASLPTKETRERRDEPHTCYCRYSIVTNEDRRPMKQAPHNDNTPAEGTPNDNVPHKETNHTPASAGSELRPAKQNTHPSDDQPPVQNQVCDQGAKGVPHTRFSGGVVLVQTWDDAKTGTNHTPAIAGVWFYTRIAQEEQHFHLSLPPALTPKSKTHDPAKDSCENGCPRTPKMTPSQYKTVPHTHFGGIQIETPEMMTYPNSEVPSCTPDHTCPISTDGTTPT